MQRIGIIGVGEIGRALAEGLAGGDDPAEVFLSPRGAAAAAELAARFPNVRVCASNQEVAGNADIVFAAMRKPDRREALEGVRFASGATVINVMSGVSNEDLRGIVGDDVDLVRAIPLPSVRERQCLTLAYPSHPVGNAVFERLGGVLPVAAEADFDVYSAVTGTLTTHYAYLATLASWVAEQGIDPADAERYVRGAFGDVGRSLGDGTRSLARLAADHETPGGNNERIRTTWFDEANAEALKRALSGLLDDLR
ncbi:NAD(P)-binding domain-containing protein [Glycomyces sp. NPDC046736]|uniref:NAD(P)-binding domain-containing protein n=1 Tax=Glycomyces sp. NPDC046736 TaxID=3155615 RepID=UPI0033D99106